MLSYQHMYHAGGLADVHKHVLLARALAHLTQSPAPVLYVETHAGRGRYQLDSAEAAKTGEAAQGIDALERQKRLAKDEPFLKALKAFRKKAGSARLYPGSPSLAAELLRANDKLWLWEMHPREHAVLARLFAKDRRATVQRADGLAGLSIKLPAGATGKQRGLVLIDPSYEIKSEYERLPNYVARLRRRWPDVAGMVWYPLLPAARHVAMADTLAQDAIRTETTWAEPGEVRGMYGSGVITWGLPERLFETPAFSTTTPSVNQG